MYLKTDKIVATIKNVVFRSYRTGLGNEYILDPTALTGWDDGTNIRRDATARPVSSGDFSEPSTFSSRLISFSGTAVATNRVQLQAMRDKLTGVLVEREYAQISVETAASTRYATVGLEGKVEWVQQLDNVAVFRVEFYAPDPYIYGYERVVSLGSTNGLGGGLKYALDYPLNYNAQTTTPLNQSVTNNGNISAWPKFKITGDYFSGFSITNGFKKITYLGPVSYSSPIVIDTAKGTAIQDGVDKSSFLTDRDWFSVAPLETIYPKFTPVQDASGWCDIIIRDTFI